MEPLLKMRRAFTAPLWDWLAPPRCTGCGDFVAGPTQPFCGRCSDTLLPVGEAVCPVCGDPGWRSVCLGCRRQPPPFARARAAFLWGGELATALRRCKYGSRLALATTLGALWAPTLQRAGRGADLLTVVPLSSASLRRRGFNQVLELCRGARLAGARLPRLAPRVLVKPRQRPAQASLSPSARRRLPASAFGVRQPRRVRGRRVLLADDVMTTGATARACAAVLLRAGARSVEVVTLARAG